jgi:hypothetical protein
MLSRVEESREAAVWICSRERRKVRDLSRPFAWREDLPHPNPPPQVEEGRVKIRNHAATQNQLGRLLN